MWAVLWCRGGDVKWAAGAAGAGPELLSLSPLSARPQTGGFVASGRPHRPKCASVHSGKTGGCEAEMLRQTHKAIVPTKGSNQ